jgi:hypothetical protein
MIVAVSVVVPSVTSPVESHTGAPVDNLAGVIDADVIAVDVTEFAPSSLDVIPDARILSLPDATSSVVPMMASDVMVVWSMMLFIFVLVIVSVAVNVYVVSTAPMALLL